MKLTTKTVHKVDYHDFDKMVQQTYNRPDYECVAWEEWSNNESHEIPVDGYVAEYDRGELEEFKNGTGNYVSAYSLLDDMASQGLIPTGDYLIEVYW